MNDPLLTIDKLLATIQAEINPGLPIAPETPLVSSGLIDSFQLTGLLTAIESTYGTRIDPADIGADNFDTPKQIHQFLLQQ